MTNSLSAGFALLIFIAGFNSAAFSLRRPASGSAQTPAAEAAQTNANGTKPVVFFVSPGGKDTWQGKLASPNAARTDGPFCTLARAKDAIRSLRSSRRLTTPVSVYLRGGVYKLNKPVVFLPEDSGTSTAPITYEAYPGERPVLSGGREITGWRKFSGSTSLSPAASHLWVVEIPEAKKGKWYFHELFVNGQRRTRARSPNQGFYFVHGLISSTAPAHFEFYDHDIRAEWAREADVEVIALQNWAEFRMPIRAVDDQSKVVTLSGRRQEFSEANARYWVENSLEALNAPGEWYLDRESGWLYYYPEPGEKMSSVRAVASGLKQLISLKGNAGESRFVSYLRFRGLTFSYTDWSIPSTGYADMQAAFDIPAAVSGEGVHSCTFEKSAFTHLGGYAIALGHGSQANRIDSNEMSDLGAGGIKIGDPKIPATKQAQTSRNQITDNHIHDIGIVYPAAVGVWIGQSGGNTVAHNEINDTFYTAISVGWTWGYGPTAARDNLIEFNNLHDIGRGMLSDMGCIYTLGVQPGTVEQNNICHDVSRYKYGGWGIYTDEGSSNILIEDNVVYYCEDGGFHQHYGEANIVRNNIFALGRNAQIRRTKDENHLSFTFEHNIIYWKDGKLLDGKWDDNNYRFDYNLYDPVGGGALTFSKWPFEEWQKRGQDIHSLIANPLFADPEHGNFSLERGSPAFKIGFKPIDLPKVGPRGDLSRITNYSDAK